MSDKPSVLVTRKLPGAVEARLQRDYKAHLNETDRLYGSDELLELAQAADAIMACHTEHFTEELFAALPKRVKAICNFSVGVDHVDLAAATARGVVVTNTPDVLSDATAEIALLLMLGAARRASEGERLIRAGKWDSWSPSFMVGHQVTGKRLGIIGMGRVGQVVARRARGLDMEIHYHNRTRLPEEREQGAVYHDSLNSLLQKSQFLSLNCPATPQTIGFFGADLISQLPEGAIFINTARGNLVDEDALLAALKSGKLAAAGLDVFVNEPQIDPRFAELANVFLLPHIGSATRETRDAMGFRALDNLDAVLSGREPGDRVA